jgi:hypothetical protein
LAPDARFAESAYLNFCGQALGSAKMAHPPKVVARTHADITDKTRMTPTNANYDHATVAAGISSQSL